MAFKRKARHRLTIMAVALVTATMALINGSPTSWADNASSGPVIEIAGGELARVNYIVINGNVLGDSAEGTDAAGDILFKLGVVWDTADIGVFTGSETIDQKGRPLGDLKGLFTIKVGDALLEQNGGVLLSFGAYSHEIYIGKVLNESLSFLLPTADGSSFTAETIKTSQIGVIKLIGGVVKAIFKLDGSVDATPRILTSPLRIQLVAGAAVTGRLLDKQFQFELTDVAACPGEVKSNPCILPAERIFIIDIGENGTLDRILLRELPKTVGQSEGEGPSQPPQTPEPSPSPGPVTTPLPPPDYSPRPPTVGQTISFWYPDPACQPSPNKRCPLAKTITLEGQTKAIKGWEWTFGDGNKSTETQPTHSYDQSKVYQACVTLTLEDNSKISDRCTQVDVWLEGRWRTEGVQLEMSVWDKQGDTWAHQAIRLDQSSIDYILVHQQPTPALGAPIIVCPVFCF